jgi:glucose/arabinose dehydrogenase/cytochrome c2
MTTRFAVLVTTALYLTAPAFAAEAPPPANAGKAVFRQQCALCHSAEANDGGGAQGPLLQGLFGRAAASGAGYANYSQALRNSGLTWDAATLDRFLTAPTEVVPGSAMVVPVASATDRANLIAYFEALGAGTFRDLAQGPGGFGPPPGAAPPPPPPKGSPEWRNDAPGVVHRVDLGALPPAFDTPSAFNFPNLVPRPQGAELSVPEGFSVETFASEGLLAPREMLVAPNGDIFIVETNPGRIKVMRQGSDGKLAGIDLYAQGLVQPYGMQFFPAEDPAWLYVAEVNRVVRYPYSSGDRVARGVPDVVVPQLSPTGGGHFTRDLQFSQDGTKMYVSVGSQSNVAENIMEPKTPAEIAAWEAQHGLGATWGLEENRAAVLAFDVGSDAPGKVYATGIRNCVSLTRQPGTDQLWCTTNERDALGDDLVPDYSTRVMEGAWYGWPWYYMGNNEDPRHAGARPDLAGKATLPDVPYTAHSAAVNLDFYVPATGSSAFPAEYVGQGFAVHHGSWNRGYRTGHKVVIVKMENGVPTGDYIDFLTGFIVTDNGAWGRPVALVQLPDGSLLLSDDGTNQVYRITYSN